MLIATRHKLRFRVSGWMRCELFGVQLCTYFTPHSEAQTSKWAREKTCLVWRGTLDTCKAKILRFLKVRPSVSHDETPRASASAGQPQTDVRPLKNNAASRSLVKPCGGPALLLFINRAVCSTEEGQLCFPWQGEEATANCAPDVCDTRPLCLRERRGAREKDRHCLWICVSLRGWAVCEAGVRVVCVRDTLVLSFRKVGVWTWIHCLPLSVCHWQFPLWVLLTGSSSLTSVIHRTRFSVCVCIEEVSKLTHWQSSLSCLPMGSVRGPISVKHTQQHTERGGGRNRLCLYGTRQMFYFEDANYFLLLFIFFWTPNDYFTSIFFFSSNFFFCTF